jgi:hypothetical protein
LYQQDVDIRNMDRLLDSTIPHRRQAERLSSIAHPVQNGGHERK